MFRLADGTAVQGYVSPPFHGDSSLPTVLPRIVVLAGQVMFWFGALPPAPDTLKEAYATLGKSAAEVFPVAFESAVPVVAGPVRGSVAGFGHYQPPDYDTIVHVL